MSRPSVLIFCQYMISLIVVCFALRTRADNKLHMPKGIWAFSTGRSDRILQLLDHFLNFHCLYLHKINKVTPARLRAAFCIENIYLKLCVMLLKIQEAGGMYVVIPAIRLVMIYLTLSSP